MEPGGPAHLSPPPHRPCVPRVLSREWDVRFTGRAGPGPLRARRASCRQPCVRGEPRPPVSQLKPPSSNPTEFRSGPWARGQGAVEETGQQEGPGEAQHQTVNRGQRLWPCPASGLAQRQSCALCGRLCLHRGCGLRTARPRRGSAGAPAGQAQAKSPAWLLPRASSTIRTRVTSA